MHTTGILYLASQSTARAALLKQAHIPFELIKQSAQETITDKNLPHHTIVPEIARAKMEMAVIPVATISTICYVITADTMCVDYKGIVHGKPVDYKDAVAMIKLWRMGCTVVTAFCIDKKKWEDNKWHTHGRVEQSVSTKVDLSIPDTWIDEYLKTTPYLTYAGAVGIEECTPFVRFIEGSYSNVLGLPMYEVRQGLETLGFFSV